MLYFEINKFAKIMDLQRNNLLHSGSAYRNFYPHYPIILYYCVCVGGGARFIRAKAANGIRPITIRPSYTIVQLGRSNAALASCYFFNK